jgi:hypothetical protein
MLQTLAISTSLILFLLLSKSVEKKWLELQHLLKNNPTRLLSTEGSRLKTSAVYGRTEVSYSALTASGSLFLNETERNKLTTKEFRSLYVM